MVGAVTEKPLEPKQVWTRGIKVRIVIALKVFLY